MKIKTKLSFSYWNLFFIPVIVFIFMAYKYAFNLYRTNTQNILTASFNQIVTNVETNLDAAMKVAEFYAMDQSLQVKKKSFTDLEAYHWLSDEIAPRLQASLQQSVYNMRIIIYLENSTIPNIYYNNSEVCENKIIQNPVDARVFEIINKNKIDKLEWYKGLKTSETSSTWIEVGDDELYGNLSYIKAVHSVQNFEIIGYIRIIVSKKDLFDSTLFNDVPYSGYFSVSNLKSGNLYYDIRTSPQEENCLVLEDSLASSDIDIHLSIPNRQIDAAALSAGRSLIFITFLCTVVLLTLTLYFSRYFRSRLEFLFHSVLESPVNSDITEKKAAGDEFDKVAETFNKISLEKKELYELSLRAQLAKKEAELSMLYSQINPHFLYNMLSTINQCAFLGKTEEVQVVSKRLAQFYRLTLSKKSMIITLQEEFEQIQSYIEILHIKYMDQLSIHVQYPPEFSSYQSPRFIIQPFIENAVLYAWKDGSLKIQVSGRIEKNCAIIIVKDNGVGMDSNLIKGLFDKKQVTDSYGINNVNDRIRLHYGSAYGIKIESIYLEGTTVTITLPLISYSDQSDNEAFRK